MLDQKCSGRPQTSEDNIGHIQEAIEQSPYASICRLSNKLDIPRRTVWRLLHFKLKKRVYCLQVRDYLSTHFSEHMDRQSCTETLGAMLPQLDTIRLLCLGLR